MIKQYTPENMHKDFVAYDVMDKKVSDIQYIENGVICVDTADYGGVVYDTFGNICNASVTYRFDKHEKIPNFNLNAEFINQDVIFMGGGYIFSHFGHFLLEGISRTYPLLDKKFQNKKLVFVVKRGTKSLPSYILTMLGGLGVKSENIILISKTTRFAGVYVPPQASVLTKYICPVMGDVFKTISKKLSIKTVKNYDKIYLSRGRMNDGRTFGEGAIEKIFAKNGYKIIYPETLPVAEQITLAHNCKIMAGTAGTALHLSLFMRRGGTIVQIKRNTSFDDNSNIQNDICKLKGLNFIHIAGSIETKPTPHFTKAPQILGVTPYLQEFFDDNKFKYAKSDIAFDKDAWDKYTKQMQKYKIQQKYSKVIKFIARIISVIGIKKHARQSIREYITKNLCAD